MEEVIDMDMEVTIAQALRQFKFKKDKKKKYKTLPQKEPAPPEFSEDLPEKNVPERDISAPEIEVCLFDNSAENHFRYMDKIAELCGESEFQFDRSNHKYKIVIYCRPLRDLSYTTKY